MDHNCSQLKTNLLTNSNKPQIKRKTTVQRRNKHRLCDIFLKKRKKEKKQTDWALNVENMSYAFNNKLFWSHNKILITVRPEQTAELAESSRIVSDWRIHVSSKMCQVMSGTLNYRHSKWSNSAYKEYWPPSSLQLWSTVDVSRLFPPEILNISKWSPDIKLK